MATLLNNDDATSGRGLGVREDARGEGDESENAGEEEFHDDFLEREVRVGDKSGLVGIRTGRLGEERRGRGGRGRDTLFYSSNRVSTKRVLSQPSWRFVDQYTSTGRKCEASTYQREIRVSVGDPFDLELVRTIFYRVLRLDPALFREELADRNSSIMSSSTYKPRRRGKARPEGPSANPSAKSTLFEGSAYW